MKAIPHRFGVMIFAGLLASCVIALSACSTGPTIAPTVGVTANQQVISALAPTGTLRIGVYLGSPTSMVIDPKSQEKKGVAIGLGKALAQQLGVPFTLVEYPRLAEVLVAMKTVNEQGLPRSAEVDMTFTNATTVRAKDVDFTAPLVSLELGYLVSTAANIRLLADIDKPGVNVGVAQGSSSQGALAKAYSAAKLVTTPSLKEAQTQLMAGRLQAFATNKAILFELLDGLPAGQFKVLDERWGLEHLAIAVPKGRESGQAFFQQFAAQMVSTGRLQSLIDHAGLRGTAKEN